VADDYNKAYKQRHAGKPKTSITIEGPNVIDESKSSFPKIPSKPEQGQLPIDDPFKKFRVSQI
jgi:hypothetical protein